MPLRARLRSAITFVASAAVHIFVLAAPGCSGSERAPGAGGSSELPVGESLTDVTVEKAAEGPPPSVPVSQPAGDVAEAASVRVPDAGTPEAGAEDAGAQHRRDGGERDAASGDASRQDASYDRGRPSGGGIDSGTADAQGTGDVGRSGGALSGNGDASAVAPCTLAGQRDCVECQGNDKPPNADKTCTPTEAKFVQRDIESHLATAPGPDPAGSCYECLLQNTCIDDTRFGDTGHECGDAAITVGSETECEAIVDCVLATSCSASSVAACYCGGLTSAQCAAANGGKSPPLGACAAEEYAGFPGASSEGDGAFIAGRYTSARYAGGLANALFNCAVNAGCVACLR